MLGAHLYANILILLTFICKKYIIQKIKSGTEYINCRLQLEKLF